MALRGLGAMGMAVTCVCLIATPALATFPGKNGDVAVTTFRHILMVDPKTGDAKVIESCGTPLCADGMSWSPDGRRLIYNRGGRAIVTSPTGKKTETVRHGVNYPEFNADGTGFYFHNEDIYKGTRVFSSDFATGASLQLTPDYSSRTHYVASSPDGSTIAYARSTRWDRDAIVLANPDGSDPRTLIPDEVAGDVVSFSPDGQKILFAAAYRTRTFVKGGLYTVDVDGGTPRRIPTESRYAIYGAEYSPDGRWIMYARGNSLGLIPADGGKERRVKVKSPKFDGFSRPPAWQPLAR